MRHSKNSAEHSNGLLANMAVRYSASAGFPSSGIAFLVLTTVISLLWSSYQPMSSDEFLSLWTDRLPSIAQIIKVQRMYPLSVDPLVFHVISHAAIRVFGAGAFAMRLPSLIGFLVMQISLFIFVRRVTNVKAAVFALAFPALTVALFYSLDGRPYGLMLGFYALAMVSWQAATRRESHRILPLITLALAGALTVNVHYFGILLFAPLCIAELFRTLQRRRLDFPLMASIAGGAASVVCILPFAKAAREFRPHYCCANLTPHLIPEVYSEMFRFRFHGLRSETIFAAFFTVAALVVLWCSFLQMCRRSVLLPEAEAVFLIVLAALPFFGYGLAVFATDVLEPRYVVCAVIGITALLAVGMSSVFSRDGFSNVILIVLFSAVTLAGIRHIYIARKSATGTMATLNMSPAIKAAIISSPSGKLYFQDADYFAFACFYEPDRTISSRFVLVYSKEQELRWVHTDLTSLTALHMRNFTNFTIEPYDSVAAQAGEFIFAIHRDPGWDWTDKALANAHAKVRSIGSAFDIDVVSVQFLPKP